MAAGKFPAVFYDGILTKSDQRAILMMEKNKKPITYLRIRGKTEETVMTEKGRRDFCIECRKETGYYLQKKDIVKNIRDKEYSFAITVAVCAECGEEMSIPGLIDKNVQEIDKQYRAAEGLVSIDDSYTQR